MRDDDPIGRAAPKVRVLFMSGYSDEVVEPDGPDAPGTAFLQKPFTPEVLLHRVREVLDAPAPDPRAAEF